MYQAEDVRVESVPDPVLHEPTDAIVRVTSACICGSDLWPYQSMPFKEEGRRMGHEFIGIVEEGGSDVSGFAPGDLVVAPLCGRITRATSAARVCTHRAATAADGAHLASMPGKAKRCGSRWPRARWSNFRLPRTRH